MTIRHYLSMLGACVLLAIASGCGDATTSTEPAPDELTEQPADPATEDPTTEDPAAEAPADTPPATPDGTAQVPAEPAPPEQGNGDYPPEAISSFLSSCEASAQQAGATPEQASEYCSCTLDEIQARYSFDEFVQVDNDIQAGQEPPAEFDVIVDTCVNRVLGEG
jgi:hypothetical protein